MTDDGRSSDDLAAEAVAISDEASPSAEGLPLIGRLNRRGFRLVMLADLVALYGIVVLSMLYRFGTRWPAYPVPLYLTSFGLICVVFVVTLYFGGLYEREPRLGAPPILPRVAGQSLAAGGLVALLNLGLTGFAISLDRATERALPLPFLNLGTLIVLGAVAVAINRRLVHWLRTRREGLPRLVVVGSPDALELARTHLGNGRKEVEVVAELTSATGLRTHVATHGATDVLLLEAELLEQLYPDRLETFEQRGITVLLRVTAQDTVLGLEHIRQVGGLPFVVLRSQTMPRSRRHFKRLFDLLVLVASAPALLALLGAVALYQLVAAGRPLLYWQERIGADGRVFRMVKFRTMVVAAEEDGRGPRLAAAHDPRVLPACRWIRATRMDELPQLWNVVRGEMSLVGPRPERPDLVRRFEVQIPGYSRRNEIPPGLTGLAQIHGRYHTDAEYKLGYDLQYLVNWTPVLDLQILARTVWVVLARRI